ncbi:phosphatidylcholine/phosphatidylserine synthase [Terrarubrum flagellatum]|uniref:CDP-alcohol phosphatidyltransferase family protein n=1 Tax=Terrirubrum flagellatum TaxID=2895980 RepID=UPI003144DA8A
MSTDEFLPPDEAPPAGRLRRFPKVPFRILIPNMITLLAICSGLTAVRLSMEGKLEWAVGAVVLAAILDAVDGRVARMLKGTSKFGAELDSLCDFVNFGCVPALMLYFFSFNGYGNFGWIAVLLFAMAMALRLARFNVMLDDPDRPPFTKEFFTGIPAPAGALCGMLPIYLHLIGMPRFPGLLTLEMIYLLAIAGMMVSRVPTYAAKSFGQQVPRDMVLPFLIVIVVFVVLLVSFPFIVLTLMTLGYLAAIPWGVSRYRRLAAEYEAAKAASAPTEPTAAA